jgi:hypothetical protein
MKREGERRGRRSWPGPAMRRDIEELSLEKTGRQGAKPKVRANTTQSPKKEEEEEEEER